MLKITVGELRSLIREAVGTGHSVRIRQDASDVELHKKLRAKHPGLEGLGVARFDSTIPLYRVIDEKEWEDINLTGRITGGRFSAPAERAVGASWASNIDEVIKFGLMWKKNGRLKGTLRILKIDGVEMQFAHVAPGFDVEKPLRGVVKIPASTCSIGMGCSVANVGLADVETAWTLDDDGKIHQINLV